MMHLLEGRFLNLQVTTDANSFQAMGLLPKCNFL